MTGDESALRSNKLAIIGGGAAGMMAAYSSAIEGNQVILLEKNENAHDNIIKVFDKYIFPKTLLSFISNLLLTILYPAIICIVAYNVLDQELTKEVVAGFSSMTVAATTISSLISQLARAFGEVQNSSVEVKVAFDLLEMQGDIETDKGSVAEELAVPKATIIASAIAAYSIITGTFENILKNNG